MLSDSISDSIRNGNALTDCEERGDPNNHIVPGDDLPEHEGQLKCCSSYGKRESGIVWDKVTKAQITRALTEVLVVNCCVNLL